MITELITKHFEHHKKLVDETLEHLSEEQMLWRYNEESSSIAVLVKNSSDDMLRTWSDFKVTAGEKQSQDSIPQPGNDLRSGAAVLDEWEKGWEVMFEALKQFSDEQMNRNILIRGANHTVLHFLLQELSAISGIAGQIVCIAKMVNSGEGKASPITTGELPADQFPSQKAPHSVHSETNSSPVCYAESREVRDEYKT